MPLLSTHIFKKFCSFLSFPFYLRRCAEILYFLSFLRLKTLSGAAGSTPSVCSLRSQPAPPRGRLMALPQSFPPLLKPSPWGRWIAAKRQDGRGTCLNSPSLLPLVADSPLWDGAFGITVQFPAKAQSLRARQRLPPRGSWQNRQVLTEGVKLPASHAKSTASLCGKRCFFQPFSVRLWKTRCSFSSSYWWGP